MAFDVHPASSPLLLAAGAARSTPVQGRFDAQKVMYVRLAATPKGTTEPEISLQVDDGEPAVVTKEPDTAEITTGAGTTVATALFRSEPDGVLRIGVFLEADVAPPQSWTIGIRNTGTLPREFVWVVADSVEETAQPWMDLPPEVAVSALTDRPTPPTTFEARNLGTGPLRMTGPGGDLGGGFTVTLPTGDVRPNVAATATVGFAAPGSPTTITVVHRFTGTDPRAGSSARHNAFVAFVATVEEPLWLPGDVLVADIRASDGNPDTAGGIVRVRPDTGRQTLVATGGLLVSPAGVAVGPDGHALVADPSGGPEGNGALVRIDRVTGEQSVLSSGGAFRDPSAVVVAPDGRIVVADPSAAAGAGALIVVDGATGDQTTVATGGPLRRPVDLAAVADGSLIALNAPTPDGTTVVRVGPDGHASVLSGPVPGPPITGVTTDGADRVLVVRAGGGPDDPAFLAVVDADGTTTALSRGDLLAAPARLAAAGDGLVLVTEWNAAGDGSAGLVMVDATDGGAQSTVSLRGLLGKPRGATVVPTTGP